MNVGTRRNVTLDQELEEGKIQFGESQKEVCVYYQGQPTDPFIFQKGVSAVDGKECVAITDPLYMLLNQKRIENLMEIGSDNVKKWFDSMINNSDDSIVKLRAKCSDEELAFMVRSRHIQRPCDIQSWANYMSNNLETFNSELHKVVNELKTQQIANVESKGAAT